MESSIVPTRQGSWRAVYHSVDGYPLRDGLRAVQLERPQLPPLAIKAPPAEAPFHSITVG
jgi:hypothetical protein